MTLVERMTGLNARLQDIPIRFGVPQFRSLSVRHATQNGCIDHEFKPLPQIRNVPLRLIGLPMGRGIEISKEDYQVSGIPRSYDRHFLLDDVIHYAIASCGLDFKTDPDGCEGSNFSPILCKLIHIFDGEMLTWELILRRFADNASTGKTEVNF